MKEQFKSSTKKVTDNGVIIENTKKKKLRDEAIKRVMNTFEKMYAFIDRFVEQKFS